MAERTELHRVLLEEHFPNPRLFAVVSWGCAATNWIAKVLNSHPEVFCLHAGNYFWKTFGNAPWLDGPDYMEVVAAQGSAFRAAGDVHGISRESIDSMRLRFGDHFRAAIVIRDPIPRLLSQVALFNKFSRFRTWDITFVDQLVDDLELRLPDHSYETKLFVHGANLLNAIVEEIEIADVYRCEDLTCNPAILTRFVNLLTNSGVDVSSTWIEGCLQIEKVNSHQDKTSKFRMLSDWQIEVVRKVVSSRSWQLYEELGYQPPSFNSDTCDSQWSSTAA